VPDIPERRRVRRGAHPRDPARTRSRGSADPERCAAEGDRRRAQDAAGSRHRQRTHVQRAHRSDGRRDTARTPLAAALDADPAARAAFDALAPSHRKEFARWIGEAKRDETRKRRIGETLRMLAEGRTR
jgi:hypothetical protein